MKIQATVQFGDQQRTFTLPCGTGNKTFKWLGNVASQRFSLSTPNGYLRRREQLSSGSETAQYQTRYVKTPSGDIPNPNELLSDYLHDGDLVTIELCDVLAVHNITSSAQPTNWTSMAYSLSQSHLDSDLGIRPQEDLEGEYSDAESLLSHELGYESNAKIESHVNFIKIMLKSQMVNPRAIEAKVDQHMPHIQKSMARVDGKIWPRIRGIFCEHWDMLTDVFHAYTSDDDRIPKDSYLNFIEDAGLFSALDCHHRGSLIFTRTCSHMPSSPSGLDMDGFLISLLFASQLKYNDTLDPRVMVSSAYEAVDSIIRDHVISLAHRLDCLSVLKSAFFSAECLVRVRVHYDVLQDFFTRAAAKQRDVPTTVHVQEFSDIMYHAGLYPTQSPAEQERSKQLLEEIRQGSLYGREVDVVEDARHPFPMSEFTFAEFVEGVARGTYLQHMRSLAKGNDESIGSADASVIVEQMVRGINAVCDYAQGKTVRVTSSKQEKRNKPRAVRK